MSKNQDPAEVLAALKQDVQSVLLATTDARGEPHNGYTPVVFDGVDMVIFVSQLALHTRDMLVQPRVSAMLIADESNSSQIHARTRLTCQCLAQVIERSDAAFDPLFDRLRERHGKMLELLGQLPDFVMFRLVPHHCQFVMGFGRAYSVTGENHDKFELVRTA